MAKGKIFSPEFRAEVARLYRMSGQTQSVMACEFGNSSKIDLLLGGFTHQGYFEIQ